MNIPTISYLQSGSFQDDDVMKKMFSDKQIKFAADFIDDGIRALIGQC